MITDHEIAKTIRFVKKKALRLKRAHKIPHYIALDLAAEVVGYETWLGFLAGMSSLTRLPR